METGQHELKRWPALERRAVAWPLQALALVLAAVVALHVAGVLHLTPRLRALAILGFLAAILLGSRRVRDTVTQVQSTILLAVVYVIGVGSAAAVSRLARRDALDTRGPKPSLWRPRAPLTRDELAKNVSRQF